MIKRVIITGTESTGKTELAGKIATHYKTIHVPDYSRSYVERLDHKYNHSDVLSIAKGIITEEDRMLHYANHILFSDNDLINIKIWLQHYRWSVPDCLEHEIVKRKADLYLLCEPDLPWVQDEQRENAHNREELYRKFVQELNAIEANVKNVKGNDDKRLHQAIVHVDDFLSRHK